MAETTVWWVLAGAAVAVELATGSFYLLMIALGLAAGAVAAHAGLGTSGQLIAAALVGGGATGAWYLRRSRQPAGPAPSANRDVNLDVGETVQVDSWRPDGTAAVRYRGAQWTAVPSEGMGGAVGPHRVREVVGNRLVLEKI